MIDDLEISQLRVQIDEIDTKLLALLQKRLEIVLEVGQRKRKLGLPVLDPKREELLLERLSEQAQAPLDPGAVRRIFLALVDENRRIEAEHMQAASS